MTASWRARRRNAWTRLLTAGDLSIMRAAIRQPGELHPGVEIARYSSRDDRGVRCARRREGWRDRASAGAAASSFPRCSAKARIGRIPANAPPGGGAAQTRRWPGRRDHAGISPGGEAESGGWATWVSGAGPGLSAQSAFGLDFFHYMVYGDANWDYKTSSTGHNLALAADKVGNVLDATSADLSLFRSRGGKLILYQGWSDAAIPPQSTVDYYESLMKQMGAKDTASFVRLFMAPGVQHCFGGAGPNVFGQRGVPMGDADHDVDAAVERWVERGIAPERIVATKYKGADANSGIERTRPLCSYPQTAHWTGKGSTDDAANFVCK